jgi:hypothetical protein
MHRVPEDASELANPKDLIAEAADTERKTAGPALTSFVVRRRFHGTSDLSEIDHPVLR